MVFSSKFLKLFFFFFFQQEQWSNSWTIHRVRSETSAFQAGQIKESIEIESPRVGFLFFRFFFLFFSLKSSFTVDACLPPLSRGESITGRACPPLGIRRARFPLRSCASIPCLKAGIEASESLRPGDKAPWFSTRLSTRLDSEKQHGSCCRE